MKIKIIFYSFLLLTPNLLAQYTDANKNGKMDIYENPEANIQDRVENLLGQMTLDEKIAQMCSFGNIQMDTLKGELAEKSTADIENGIGQLSRSGEALFPEQTVEIINALQKYLLEKTRLGIPAIVRRSIAWSHDGRSNRISTGHSHRKFVEPGTGRRNDGCNGQGSQKPWLKFIIIP